MLPLAHIPRWDVARSILLRLGQDMHQQMEIEEILPPGFENEISLMELEYMRSIGLVEFDIIDTPGGPIFKPCSSSPEGYNLSININSPEAWDGAGYGIERSHPFEWRPDACEWFNAYSAGAKYLTGEICSPNGGVLSYFVGCTFIPTDEDGDVESCEINPYPSLTFEDGGCAVDLIQVYRTSDIGTPVSLRVKSHNPIGDHVVVHFDRIPNRYFQNLLKLEVGVVEKRLLSKQAP